MTELATTATWSGRGRAFDPFWGFLLGWWKWISGVINNVAYPLLCIDYLKLVLLAFTHGPMRQVAICLYKLLLSYLNYTGLSIMGWIAVTLGVVSLAPFALMFLISIPWMEPFPQDLGVDLYVCCAYGVSGLCNVFGGCGSAPCSKPGAGSRPLTEG